MDDVWHIFVDTKICPAEMYAKCMVEKNELKYLLRDIEKEINLNKKEKIMKNMDKSTIAKLVFLVCITIFIFYCAYSQIKDNEVKKQEINTENKVLDNDIKTDNITDDSTEKLPIEINGLSDEALKILGTNKIDISKKLKEWLDGNGFSSSSKVEFYQTMDIDFSENTYTMQCQINYGTEGNGIINPDNPNPIITMKYFKDDGMYLFYK